MIGPSKGRPPMSHRKTDLGIPRRSKSAKVVLERVRGTIGDDGIERISTQTLFDHLEVLQRARRAGACRRLAQVMRRLGWTPVRVRDLTRGGYLEQVREYARDT